MERGTLGELDIVSELVDTIRGDSGRGRDISCFFIALFFFTLVFSSVFCPLVFRSFCSLFYCPPHPRPLPGRASRERDLFVAPCVFACFHLILTLFQGERAVIGHQNVVSQFGHLVEERVLGQVAPLWSTGLPISLQVTLQVLDELG